MDRFKGMSEEEVMKKTLPDLLDYNLDYVIVRVPRLCRWQCCPRSTDQPVCAFRSESTRDSWRRTSDAGFQDLGTTFVSQVTPAPLKPRLPEG